MYEKLRKKLLEKKKEYNHGINKFMKNFKEPEVGKDIGRFDVLQGIESPLELIKGLKKLQQIKIASGIDILFQEKLEKLEKTQIEHEVKHNMGRGEFENYLKKIDLIEQGRSSFGLAVRKKLEVLKELKNKNFLQNK